MNSAHCFLLVVAFGTFWAKQTLRFIFPMSSRTVVLMQDHLSSKYTPPVSPCSSFEAIWGKQSPFTFPVSLSDSASQATCDNMHHAMYLAVNGIFASRYNVERKEDEMNKLALLSMMTRASFSATYVFTHESK